jgi:hypothetical protein
VKLRALLRYRWNEKDHLRGHQNILKRLFLYVIDSYQPINTYLSKGLS